MDEPLRRYVTELMDDYMRNCRGSLTATERDSLIRKAVNQVDALAHDAIRQLLQQCLMEQKRSNHG